MVRISTHLRRPRLVTTILACLFALAPSRALAGDAGTADEPKTKIAAFMAQGGSVYVRSFSAVGTVQGDSGGSVEVSAVVILRASAGATEHGIWIRVVEGDHGERTAYVDDDEVMDLVKGIDYVSRLDPSTLPLHDYEATYRTRDGLLITVFSSARGTRAAVEIRGIPDRRVFLTTTMLANFRVYIAKANALVSAPSGSTTSHPPSPPASPTPSAD